MVIAMIALQGRIDSLIEEAVAAGTCSGATVSVWHRGAEVVSASAGHLSNEREEECSVDTWFDLASLTKYFSAITIHVLVERGLLGYDQPIAVHLDGFRGDEQRERVTLRHLLTHTSGIPDIYPAWEPALMAWLAEHPETDTVGAWPVPNRDALREEFERLPLVAEPGTQFIYSCVGYNTAMLLAEKATRRPWFELVSDLTLRPLGVEIDYHAPTPPAATEIDHVHRRGVIQGHVHDEFSWALGGHGANAGLFGTAYAVASAFDRLRRDDLPCLAEALWENQIPRILGRELCDPEEAPWGHSMGLRIGQVNFMGSTVARGHTGFTGTSCWTEHESELTVALLTNRVHPTRDGDIAHNLRLAVASAAREGLARPVAS